MIITFEIYIFKLEKNLFSFSFSSILMEQTHFLSNLKIHRLFHSSWTHHKKFSLNQTKFLTFLFIKYVIFSYYTHKCFFLLSFFISIMIVFLILFHKFSAIKLNYWFKTKRNPHKILRDYF